MAVPSEPPQVHASEIACTRARRRLSVGSALFWLWQTAQTVLPAVAVALMLNALVARACTVKSISMEPTLHETQRLIMERVSYYTHPPHRGDIVVFSMVSLGPIPYIKRVIGLPGEWIETRAGRVYINDRLLEEPYLRAETWPGIPLTRVPADAVFVLGDNRTSSSDSRDFGCVPYGAILGRAWFRYWPPSAAGIVH
ncbi:MAG: signal peptidase I [Anaerolineae bacterium]